MNASKATFLPRIISVPLFLVGPLLSVVLGEKLLGSHLYSGDLPLATLVILLFWSPLFFSVPALIMQDARDAFMSTARGLNTFKRALLLVPAMLKKESGVRVEMLASLVGFAAAVIFSLPALTQVSSLL